MKLGEESADQTDIICFALRIWLWFRYIVRISYYGTGSCTYRKCICSQTTQSNGRMSYDLFCLGLGCPVVIPNPWHALVSAASCRQLHPAPMLGGSSAAYTGPCCPGHRHVIGMERPCGEPGSPIQNAATVLFVPDCFPGGLWRLQYPTRCMQ
jgi:hypothetical protein